MGSERAFFDAAVPGGHEDIVARRLDSPYRPGRRSHAWRKVKPQKSARGERDPRGKPGREQLVSFP